MRVVLLLFLLIAGCSQVSQVKFIDIAGNQCETTKVKPDFYTAETYTACIDQTDGAVVQVQTNHSDLTMLYGVGGVVAALLGVLSAQGL